MNYDSLLLNKKEVKYMPNGDQTGPNGRGPMTGRGLGPCGNGQVVGCGLGRGIGRGAGQGFGRRANY